MAVTQVDFNDQPIEISADSGTTWKSLVCLESASTNFTSDVSETITQCGVITGRGDAKATLDFQAVCSTTPGAAEVSFEVALGWKINNTALQVRVSQGSSGADWYYLFTAYLDSLVHEGTSGDLMKFSGTFTSSGLVDITP